MERYGDSWGCLFCCLQVRQTHPHHPHPAMLLRPSRPTLFGRRLLATLANPSSSSPQPVFGLDEAALDLPPPKPEGPNGLLPVSPSSRLSRLEYHYLNTLREDLMILHYDHGSRLLQKLDSLPEWTEGTRAPEDLLARVFSVQDPIARDRVKGGGPSRYGRYNTM